MGEPRRAKPSVLAALLPVVRRVVPGQLDGVGPEGSSAPSTRSQPSLIRIEADELTYDLHILLRFELERELFDGTLEPRDLPEAWNERMRAYLGIDVPDDAHGVLQDVHWAERRVRLLPDLLARQRDRRAAVGGGPTRRSPTSTSQIERGDFVPLREWLRENVHRHGRKYSAAEVVERATGRPIEVAPYVRYLTTKFRALYG